MRVFHAFAVCVRAYVWVCLCVCKGEIEKERGLSGGFVGITIFVRERQNNYYTRRESVTFILDNNIGAINVIQRVCFMYH